MEPCQCGAGQSVPHRRGDAEGRLWLVHVKLNAKAFPIHLLFLQTGYLAVGSWEFTVPTATCLLDCTS